MSVVEKNDTTPIAADQSPLWKRIAWMGAIWLTSVAVLGIISLIIKLWLKA